MGVSFFMPSHASTILMMLVRINWMLIIKIFTLIISAMYISSTYIRNT